MCKFETSEIPRQVPSLFFNSLESWDVGVQEQMYSSDVKLIRKQTRC